MEKQYCKVGTITPMTEGAKAVALLEHQYKIFMEKASHIEYAGTKLGDFFEQKAEKIQKYLESLMH